MGLFAKVHLTVVELLGGWVDFVHRWLVLIRLGDTQRAKPWRIRSRTQSRSWPGAGPASQRPFAPRSAAKLPRPVLHFLRFGLRTRKTSRGAWSRAAEDRRKFSIDGTSALCLGWHHAW